MRYLIVSHSAGLLGAERSLVEITEGATAAGHEVIVALPKEGPLRNACEAVGARCEIVSTHAWMGPRHRVAGLGLFRLIQARRDVPALCALIEETAPDAVISNTSVIPVAAWAAHRLRRPHVWIVRESLLTNKQLRSILPKRMIASTIIRRSAAVMAVSEFVERQVRAAAGSQSAPIWPIRPRPVLYDVGVSGRAPKNKDSLRLVLPGHISVEKGHFLAVRALRKAGTPNVTLDVVGTGPRHVVVALRMLIALSGLSSQVRLLGWMDDMQTVYQRHDALLMVSKNEAFGRTTVEAITSGLPVIALDSGGSSELLREGGGELVQPTTAEALANIIRKWAAADTHEWASLLSGLQKRAALFMTQPSQYSYVEKAIKEVGIGN